MSARDARPFRGLDVTLDEADGSFEKMLRKFVRRTRDDGTIDEVRSRARGFVKPSMRRRTKASKALRSPRT